MGLPKPRPLFTVEQYLAIERPAQDRHEFLDGEIYAMAGESWPHGTITGNLFVLIAIRLRGTKCQVQSKDMKVRSGPSPVGANKSRGLYSYPDIVVVCDEPEFHDAETDIVLNPKVIIEVLSPSTEAFDRGEKWNRYQTWNPTLTDYVLVSQSHPQVEQFTRRSDGKWNFERYADMSDVVVIASIDCQLKLAEIYERVKFGA